MWNSWIDLFMWWIYAGMTVLGLNSASETCGNQAALSSVYHCPTAVDMLLSLLERVKYLKPTQRVNLVYRQTTCWCWFLRCIVTSSPEKRIHRMAIRTCYTPATSTIACTPSMWRALAMATHRHDDLYLLWFPEPVHLTSRSGYVNRRYHSLSPGRSSTKILCSIWSSQLRSLPTMSPDGTKLLRLVEVSYLLEGSCGLLTGWDKGEMSPLPEADNFVWSHMVCEFPIAMRLVSDCSNPFITYIFEPNVLHRWMYCVQQLVFNAACWSGTVDYIICWPLVVIEYTRSCWVVWYGCMFSKQTDRIVVKYSILLMSAFVTGTTRLLNDSVTFGSVLREYS